MILQHNVRCLRTGKLYSVTGKESLQVSSIHHQAVKKLACGFKASAFADDGVIESIESDSEHIWGVQFHPELQAVEGDEAMKNYLCILSVRQGHYYADSDIKGWYTVSFTILLFFVRDLSLWFVLRPIFVNR